MKSIYDVVVVGGGAIGMASAWRLAARGMKVLVIDKGRLGAEASSAAAGMLGAQLETHQAGPFYDLCRESRALYPAYVAELLEYTGIDAQLVHNGILQLAYTEADATLLLKRANWQRQAGDSAVWMDASEIRAAELTIRPVHGGLFLPNDGNVSAPRLAKALARAVGMSCDVREGSPVFAIEKQTGGTFEVVTANERFPADKVLISAGTWASSLLRPWGCALEIQPVKGQMLSIRPPFGTTLRRTVYAGGTYLVPKRDGTVVVGATEEREAGFSREVTIGAISALSEALREIAPGLSQAEFLQSWTGLRPGSPNGEPRIGELPGLPGLMIAVGHFRNGILLSAITAEMVAAAATGEVWPERWRPFHPAQTVKVGR
ncbi:glycine oxidase ThiO [Alicyclobacillus sacchari]|uniref:glycine oxidase ThiO n=1 Tax=Alicyclobacillus sacchari TaxID=392010 RepID=UPI0023E9A0A1|nr:glycine oxidase ThiO [Alicyclobacillus sacchari]GMA56754.1 glycine oxidase ThiO [Alicyclobacillus sacchari]